MAQLRSLPRLQLRWGARGMGPCGRCSTHFGQAGKWGRKWGRALPRLWGAGASEGGTAEVWQGWEQARRLRTATRGAVPTCTYPGVCNPQASSVATTRRQSALVSGLYFHSTPSTLLIHCLSFQIAQQSACGHPGCTESGGEAAGRSQSPGKARRILSDAQAPRRARTPTLSYGRSKPLEPSRGSLE